MGSAMEMEWNGYPVSSFAFSENYRIALKLLCYSDSSLPGGMGRFNYTGRMCSKWLGVNFEVL